MLHINDVLVHNLIYAAASYDARNGRNEKEILKGAIIQKLLESIHSCGVSFHIYESDKTAFDFTSLVGSSKITLLEKLPLS